MQVVQEDQSDHYVLPYFIKADFIRNSGASSNVPPRDIPLESMKTASVVVG